MAVTTPVPAFASASTSTPSGASATPSTPRLTSVAIAPRPGELTFQPGSLAGATQPGSVAGVARPGSLAGVARPGSVAGVARPGSVAGVARPGSLAGVARPGSLAGVARPGSLAGTGKPRPLSEALLTASELPDGYRAMAAGGGMSMAAAINTDANLCNQHVGAMVHKGQSAAASFVKDGGGTVLIESLSATGARGARAVVRGVAVAPSQCPTVMTSIPTTGQKVQLRLAPLRVAKLGDAAAGLQFTVAIPDTDISVNGKMIAVARQGVAVTIMMLGVPQITPQEVNRIATAAVRKLQHDS